MPNLLTRRWLWIVLAIPVVLVLALLVWLRLTFGGGEPYADLTTEPTLGPDALEAAVVSPRPVGNAAVSADGRVFFTVHPESQPTGPKLYEWRDGEAVPWPREDQDDLFQSPLGLVVDRQERLWVIDPGHHGTGQPRLLAFDLASGEVVHRHDFADDVAPLGSFLQDLQIDAAGETVYIADVGFWIQRPALVVYDVTSGIARRLLERHPSVMPQPWIIHTDIRPMEYFGGWLAMKTGVDGIALTRDGLWLYYAAMNHDTMFRLPVEALKNESLSREQLEKRIQKVGRKPLNDGLSTDDQGNVFITDVENQAVVKMRPDGSLETIVRDERIRWADGLSFGPDGWLYLADSAIPHLVLQSQEHIQAQAPYHVWRFQPGTRGWAGQ